MTSNSDKMGLRYPPMAFTEQGVAMLSSVLNSEKAIQVNIQIMRAFTRLRQMLASNEELKRKIEEMESKYDEQFRVVFEAIRQLLAKEEKPELLGLYCRLGKYTVGLALEKGTLKKDFAQRILGLLDRYGSSG